jgi:membrane fusion protein (multidrug efflux system)
MVVDKDNKVESRVVEVDRAYDGQWVIGKGLNKGEKVIVDGLQKVRSGATVRVKQGDDAGSSEEANQAKATKTETTQEDTPPKKE